MTPTGLRFMTALELNEKNIMTLEFYLSDQAELQTDGTMEFQCN